MRFHSAITLICTLASLSGCDGGTQEGRFVVNGRTNHAVAKMTGGLCIVYGDATPVSPQSFGQEPLMYILALAPLVRSSGSGVAGSDGRFVSNYEWMYGDISMQLTWDRRSDIVTVDGATFDRSQGNGFVLVRDATGRVGTTQVGPIDAGLDQESALKAIQNVLPAHSIARDVTLGK